MGYLVLLGPSFFSLQDSIELMFSLVLLFWWHHFFGGFLESSHQVLVLWVCWLVFGIDILLMLFKSFFIFSSMHLTTPSFVSFLVQYFLVSLNKDAMIINLVQYFL